MDVRHPSSLLTFELNGGREQGYGYRCSQDVFCQPLKDGVRVLPILVQVIRDGVNNHQTQCWQWSRDTPDSPVVCAKVLQRLFSQLLLHAYLDFPRSEYGSTALSRGLQVRKCV